MRVALVALASEETRCRRVQEKDESRPRPWQVLLHMPEQPLRVSWVLLRVAQMVLVAQEWAVGREILLRRRRRQQPACDVPRRADRRERCWLCPHRR